MGRKSKAQIAEEEFSTERKDGRRVKKITYDGKEPFNAQGYIGPKYFYGWDNDEIRKKIEEFESSLTIPPPPPPPDLMCDLIDEWWEEKEKNISPNSISSYKAKMEEIDTEFGKIPVREITPQLITGWLTKKSLQQLSQRGISDRKSVMKNILDYALLRGMIDTNPCIGLPVIKGKPRQPRNPAAESDTDVLEQHKTDSMLTRMLYFLEYSGCRIGEAIVLQEKDIDREHHRAHIWKDVAWIGNVPTVKERPKTAAGNREIDLYDNVLEVLPQYDDPDTYIFFPDGLPHKSALQKQQVKLRKLLGMTSTAHQFRHTYASIMHSAEIDVKDASARLGHANVAVTQDIYTAIERAHNEKTRNKANEYIMNERLGRNKKRCPHCGSINILREDDQLYAFCPDCGNKL